MKSASTRSLLAAPAAVRKATVPGADRLRKRDALASVPLMVFGGLIPYSKLPHEAIELKGSLTTKRARIELAAGWSIK